MIFWYFTRSIFCRILLAFALTCGAYWATLHATTSSSNATSTPKKVLRTETERPLDVEVMLAAIDMTETTTEEVTPQHTEVISGTGISAPTPTSLLSPSYPVPNRTELIISKSSVGVPDNTVSPRTWPGGWDYN